MGRGLPMGKVKGLSRREKRHARQERRLDRKERKLARRATRRAFRGRRRRYRIRNLSLRMSFMLYMLVFGLLALFLSLGTASVFTDMREQIRFQYTYTLEMDDMARLYFGAMPEEAEGLYNLYGALAVLSIPGCTILCLMAASFLFYRKKLKVPISLLQSASAEIARNNLAVKISYDRRDEMGKLCDSFETMRAALDENYREMWRQMEERKRLNAAFSHDLRTPLTVLNGYAELLQRHLPQNTLPPEKIMETVASMSGQIDRLKQYTESMTTLQRLEDMAIEPQPVWPGMLENRLRDAASAVLTAAGKRLRFEADLREGPLLVDVSILMRVYENLVANAARFAEDTVSIRVAVADERLTLTVRDDGKGFSEEALRRATDPFYTGGDADGTHFGLGLNICDILCMRHGGTLKIANGADGGARVEAVFVG